MFGVVIVLGLIRLASQSRSRALVTERYTGAHDSKGASSRADWAIPGPFWVMVNSPASLDVSTSSKKWPQLEKKVQKLGIHNIIIFTF